MRTDWSRDRDRSALAADQRASLPMLGTTTLISSRTPITISWTLGSMFICVIAICRVATMAADSTTPSTVPLPPKIDTPPKSAIATTLSSSP